MCVYESESRSVIADTLQPHGLYTVHGILQARILECLSLLQGIFPTQVSCIACGFFTIRAPREACVCTHTVSILRTYTDTHHCLYCYVRQQSTEIANLNSELDQLESECWCSTTNTAYWAPVFVIWKWGQQKFLLYRLLKELNTICERLKTVPSIW